MEAINFDALENALKTFESALASPVKSDLERDGVIQRFEYTFELSWKSIRKLLLVLGRSDVSASPKPLFRSALEEHLINDINKWFKYTDARNRTSHTYNQITAKSVFDDIQDFAVDARSLLDRLNEKLRNS